jgi:hypothetical protein
LVLPSTEDELALAKLDVGVTAGHPVVVHHQMFFSPRPMVNDRRIVGTTSKRYAAVA